nr:MAG TPA: hypothetical protein [Caudoviricetes sp.]
MAEIKDEYIQWPGEATFPSEDTTPAYDRYANGNSTVHSHKGWEWVESDNPFQKAAAALAQSTIEASIRRVRTTFGQVFYQKGNATDKPDFPGEAYGDTARIQDPSTLDIVAEWKWNGLDWERARVSGEQISNLDVGRLTAGSAAINDLAARRIAGDIGKFLQLTTDQLTVTGNASFVDLTAKHVWTRIINARQGEFEKIKAGMLDANSVSASNIQGGAIDGQVITGATIQTDRSPTHGLKIDSTGIRAYTGRSSETSFEVNASNGRVKVLGEVGIQDTWSIAKFTDIIEVQSGNDVGQRGDRWGVGILMNGKTFPYKYPALITYKEDPTNAGGILYFQAPSSYDSSTPNMRLSTTGLSVYSGKTSAWSMNLSRSGFGASAPGKGGIQVNDYMGSITVGGYDAHLYIQGDVFRLRSTQDRWKAVWCNGNAVVMGWDQTHQAIVDRDGFRAVGGKNFIMRVPGEWQKRHMMLQHASTESPHDGIEYWENVELNSEGRATWVLPDYIPKIASPTAPWIVLTSSSASAKLTQAGYGVDAAPWSVEVVGQPGETVAVLVKGARQIDEWDMKTDHVALRDRSKESEWVLPPAASPDDEGAVSSAVAYDGRGGYGPSPTPPPEPPTDSPQGES